MDCKCREKPDEFITSEHDVQAVIDAVYKQDSLSILNKVYKNFFQLLSCRHGPAESFANYEARFSALFSTFTAYGRTLRLHGSLLEMMVVSGAHLDDAHHITILSSAGSGARVTLTTISAEMAKVIQYEAIGTVIRQIDNGPSSKSRFWPGATASASAASWLSISRDARDRPGSGSYRGSFPEHANKINERRPCGSEKNRLFSEDLCAFKLKCVGLKYDMYGPCAKHHNSGDSIKDNLPSIPASGNEASAAAASPACSSTEHDAKQHNKSNVMTRTGTLSADSPKRHILSHLPVPLVDDGAPHNATG